MSSLSRSLSLSLFLLLQAAAVFSSASGFSYFTSINFLDETRLRVKMLVASVVVTTTTAAVAAAALPSASRWRLREMQIFHG